MEIFVNLCSIQTKEKSAQVWVNPRPTHLNEFRDSGTIEQILRSGMVERFERFERVKGSNDLNGFCDSGTIERILQSGMVERFERVKRWDDLNKTREGGTIERAER